MSRQLTVECSFAGAISELGLLQTGLMAGTVWFFCVHLMAIDLSTLVSRLEAALDSTSTLALALGANLPSPVGDPLQTLPAVPLLLTSLMCD